MTCNYILMVLSQIDVLLSKSLKLQNNHTIIKTITCHILAFLAFIRNNFLTCIYLFAIFDFFKVSILIVKVKFFKKLQST